MKYQNNACMIYLYMRQINSNKGDYKMEDPNKNVDPLAALINKHKAAAEDAPTPNISTEPAAPTIPDDEDIYGENDQQKEIEAEDRRRDDERRAMAAEFEANKEANKKGIMPPDEKDMSYHADAIGFQTEKLAIVTTMINKVVAKYKLISGGIPQDNMTDNEGNVVLGQVAVKGELTDLYERNGDVITPEFEKIILDNWIMPDGTFASDNIVNGVVVDRTITPVTTDAPVSTDNATAAPTTTEPEKNPTINITVEKDTPVTVNVDESITANFAQTRQVDIVVKEVTEQELLRANIIENSNIEGIITTYDAGINDVPVTLPLSGYRCVIRAINWMDFIKLTAPSSNNPVDNELKKWSVIYDHLKNVSIGEFKDLEDFMKKTKYQDRELLMWGLLVATSDDEENIEIRCGNPRCRKPIKLKYRPRNIYHLDETRIPKWWTAAHNAAPGEDAVKVFDSASGLRKRYKLNKTGIIVEINEPSAYEFVTEKLPLVNELYKRYRPDGNMAEMDPNDPTMMEFDYLSANAMFVSAMTIVRNENGKVKEYRFTDWESIEEIITKSLDAEDSSALLKIIEKARNNVSPVTFRINDVTCDSCKQHIEYIPINDIGSTLLFQVSQRLSNTQINLIEMD